MERSTSFVELWASDHLLTRIYEYLALRDLCAVSATCRALLHCPSEDAAWRGWVQRRWALSDKARRALGGTALTSMRDLYKLLHLRLQVPDGRYTAKHNAVFARAAQRGAAAWLLVGHASTAMLRETRVQGELCRRAEVRLCVQNLQQHTVSLSLAGSAVQLSCAQSEEVKEGLLPHSDLRLLARNGALVPALDATATSHNKPVRVELQRLEYAVLSCFVYCPESVESEPDFLTMLCALSLSLDLQAAHSAEPEPLTLSLRRCADEEIWSHYQTLPNGLVMLRDKQNNW